MNTPPEPSREKRNSVIVRAAVSVPGGPPVEHRVRNLSRSGACIDNTGEFVAGMLLRLDMGHITELTGEVVWVKDRLAGIRFAEPIDLDEARKPRGVTAVPKAGWMANINDAYRR
jgi:hypothetical protein